MKKNTTFSDLIQNVEKLTWPEKITPKPNKRTSPTAIQKNMQPIAAHIMYASSPDESVGPSSRFFYTVHGVDPRQIKKQMKKMTLRYPSLDLHGHTLDSYKGALALFLQQHIQHKCAVVHIIHGKGSLEQPSKIKQHIVNDLKQHPNIKAFASCDKSCGGTGALWAWLKYMNN